MKRSPIVPFLIILLISRQYFEVLALIQVKVLRSMRPIKLEDVVIGQYKSHSIGGVTYPSYTDDKTVPKGSLTPTFAAAALFIDNARWDGVPFLMKAGKALNTRRYQTLEFFLQIFWFACNNINISIETVRR